MPLPKEPVVITQSTGISVGLTRALIAVVVVSTVFIVNLSSNVGYVGEVMREVKKSVDKNTETMIATSQRVAIYEAELRAVRERLARVEKN